MVNVALVSRESYRSIADRYGLSETSLKRHAQEHIPQLLAKAKDAVEREEARDLEDALRGEMADIQRLKSLAEEGEDYRTALTACDKALKAVELQARVMQVINESATVNIELNHQWIELKTVILEALGPHKRARLDVMRAIREVTSSGRN